LICKYIFNFFISFINYKWFLSYFFYFSRYDFDRDGSITKEDVRLILSHVPIEKTVKTLSVAEGLFTREGGNN